MKRVRINECTEMPTRRIKPKHEIEGFSQKTGFWGWIRSTMQKMFEWYAFKLVILLLGILIGGAWLGISKVGFWDEASDHVASGGYLRFLRMFESAPVKSEALNIHPFYKSQEAKAIEASTGLILKDSFQYIKDQGQEIFVMKSVATGEDGPILLEYSNLILEDAQSYCGNLYYTDRTDGFVAQEDYLKIAKGVVNLKKVFTVKTDKNEGFAYRNIIDNDVRGWEGKKPFRCVIFLNRGDDE
jgi:hypothetical protein